MVETIVTEIGNVGLTLIICIGCVALVQYLDKKVFNKNRRNKND